MNFYLTIFRPIVEMKTSSLPFVHFQALLKTKSLVDVPHFSLLLTQRTASAETTVNALLLQSKLNESYCLQLV